MVNANNPERAFLRRRAEYVAAVRPVVEMVVGEDGYLKDMFPNPVAAGRFIDVVADYIGIRRIGRIEREFVKHKDGVVRDPVESRYRRLFRKVGIEWDEGDTWNSAIIKTAETVTIALNNDFELRAKLPPSNG